MTRDPIDRDSVMASLDLVGDPGLLPIDVLNLPPRAYNALIAYKIFTVGQCLDLPKYGIKNYGQTSRSMLKGALIELSHILKRPLNNISTFTQGRMKAWDSYFLMAARIRLENVQLELLTDGGSDTLIRLSALIADRLLEERDKRFRD